MMRLSALVLVATSCGFPASVDVTRVTGTVHGLWDGNDGVTLHLTANGVDRTLTITTDGDFALADLLAAGTAYSVEVVANPTAHTCIVTHGVGTASDTAPAVDVACTGPAMTIALSAPVPWTFDPTLSAQTVPLSLLTQAASITVTGAIDGAQLGGVELALGVASARQMLPSGQTTLTVAARAGALAKTYTIVLDRGARGIEQSAYVKESTTHTDDNFTCCALNYAFDGDLVAVGAVGAANRDGAVYVFRRDGATWTQEAILTASNGEAEDYFGFSVAIAGGLIVVGAPYEASGATGIDPVGGQSDNSAPGAGAVYVFRRATDMTWSQQNYIKASNATANDTFGTTVALLGGGAGTAVLAVGAISLVRDASFGSSAGSVYLFGFDLDEASGLWRELATVQSPNPQPAGSFGRSFALNGDLFENSATLLVGAPGEGGATTVTGVGAKGAAYVFDLFAEGLQQVSATLDASLHPAVASLGDYFGTSVAMSGTTVVVGAYGESSGGHGVDSGRETDHSAPLSGAAYVFEREAGGWSLRHYLKASNAGGVFGGDVSVMGNLIAIGAGNESSQSAGVNQPAGGGSDSTDPASGAAYVFARTADSWAQIAYIKASNPQPGAYFGASNLALSLDTLLAGGSSDSSDATGINPPTGQNDTSAPSAGALYIFR